jgi:hypothetical protein
MTSDKNPKTTRTKPHDYGDKVSEAHQAKYEIATSRAQHRIHERNEAGKLMPKLSDDDWDTILDRIANGEIPAQVMRSYDVQPHTLAAKAKRDIDFDKRLSEAYSHAFFDHMIDARSVARGLEGFTTGSIERDKLVIDTDWRLAKALVPRLIDKQQVDTRSISITVQKDDTEW